MPTSISLLPQSAQGLLLSPSDRLRVLILKKNLIDEAIRALENFSIYRCASAFDGHIGDNLCQIRAYQIYLLILTQEQNNDDIPNQLKELKYLSSKLFGVITEYQTDNHRNEQHQTVTDFFQEKKITCKISELSLYLTQLHLLSNFKAYKNNGDLIIDYQKMCATLNVSKHTARKIVHIYQINISNLSCKFIYSLMLKSNNKISQNIFDNFMQIDEDGRFTLPCYWVMQVLYESMLKQKCPLLIICDRYINQKHIDTIELAFKVSINERNYEACPLNNISPQEFCFVIKGDAYLDDISLYTNESNYIKHFITQGIKKVLFSNMASHPQYSGKKLISYKESPYLKIAEEKTNLTDTEKMDLASLIHLHAEQQEMCEHARKFGYGKFDHAFFYIRHIFCDTLNNPKEQLNESYKEMRLNGQASVARAIC